MEEKELSKTEFWITMTILLIILALEIYAAILVFPLFFKHIVDFINTPI